MTDLWPIFLSAGSLIAVVMGGIWKILQSQFTYLERESERLHEEQLRRDNSVQEAIRTIQKELDSRRVEFMHVDTFNQFEQRVLSDITTLRLQLSVIEQTRPTTGELEARLPPKRRGSPG